MGLMMKKVFIVSAKRTAIGAFLGTIADVHPSELGGTVIKAMLQETGLEPKVVDEVIIGNVLSAGQGQGIARQVALKGGIPIEIPAYAVNMVCGSGMKAVMNGYSTINSGMNEVVIAGGVESMSTAPYLLPGAIRQGQKLGDITGKDHMVFDALTDAFGGYHMGVTAENIAERFRITREEQDQFAYESQQKAIKAVDSGKMIDEIVPIEVRLKKETILFVQDEYINRTTNLDKLSKLRPAFIKEGTVTAGNASGLNDGASMVLLASEAAVIKYKLIPLAEIVAVGQGGVEPSLMGLGPVPAIAAALKKSELSLEDMDLLELNEAFAAQSLGVVSLLAEEHKLSKEALLTKTNVNGGAIAFGHPVGVSGNRILVSLVHEMKKRAAVYGLASLCIGGGMGTAVILKNITQ